MIACIGVVYLTRCCLRLDEIPHIHNCMYRLSRDYIGGYLDKECTLEGKHIETRREISWRRLFLEFFQSDYACITISTL